MGIQVARVSTFAGVQDKVRRMIDFGSVDRW